jgi:hypothetical protein
MLRLNRVIRSIPSGLPLFSRIPCRCRSLSRPVYVNQSERLHGICSILDDSEVTVGDLLLQDADYPPYFKHMQHPEDLKECTQPIIPEYIRHHQRGHHRLLFRVSFKMDNGAFIPLTFLCDTGAPSHFYLSREAYKVLEEGGRILGDELLDYMVVNEAKVAVRATPYTHDPGNIMGLLMLEKLGLSLKEGGFSFSQHPQYF